MNGRDDGDDDKKQPEQDVAASAHSDTVTSTSAQPGADDSNQVKATTEPRKTDSTESVAAETLQRVRVTEIAMVVLTAVIAFSSLATLWVYWHQLDVMQDTLDEIRTGGIDTHALAKASSKQANALTDSIGPATTSAAKASETSANNSDRIARGSEDAVKTAQASMRLDQRAWVGIGDIADFHFTADGSPIANVIAINTGKTPALNVRLHGEFQFVPIRLAVPPADMSALPGHQNSNLKTVTVLHAGQKTAISLKPGVYDATMYHPEIFAAVQDGRQVLYLRVLITYDDVFTPKHAGVGIHRTEVCERYIPALKEVFGCDFGNYAN